MLLSQSVRPRHLWLVLCASALLALPLASPASATSDAAAGRCGKVKGWIVKAPRGGNISCKAARPIAKKFLAGGCDDLGCTRTVSGYTCNLTPIADAGGCRKGKRYFDLLR